MNLHMKIWKPTLAESTDDVTMIQQLNDWRIRRQAELDMSICKREGRRRSIRLRRYYATHRHDSNKLHERLRCSWHLLHIFCEGGDSSAGPTSTPRWTRRMANADYWRAESLTQFRYDMRWWFTASNHDVLICSSRLGIVGGRTTISRRSHDHPVCCSVEAGQTTIHH